MNILFNGNSFTWGFNLEDRSKRYPVLLSNKLNATFTDISDHGCSNRSIIRRTFNHDVSQYDLAIVSLTFKNRTEFFLDGQWEKINPGRGRGKKFLEYYEKYYSEEYGESDEFIYRQALISHFQAKNVELLLCTSAKNSTYPYDFLLNTPDIPLGDTKHPTEEGHYIISEKIYEKISKMGKIQV